MSAISTPTTIAPDFAGQSARPTSSPRSRRRMAWIAGSAAAALVAGAGVLAWAQTTSPAVDVSTQVGAVSDVELLAHGGAGTAVNGLGVPIGPVPALSAGSDLVAHGGAGSVWTVSGSRIR